MRSRGLTALERRGPGRKIARRAAVLLAAGLFAGGPGGGLAARAAECGLELVLAMDVSRSVVNWEYDLQLGGLAAAFRHPEVAEAIGWVQGGVMATVTQWSGPGAQLQVVPWSHLTDAGSAAAFAVMIEAAERESYVAYTAIGEALFHANRLSATNPKRCAKRVIDLSGDGVSNRGRETAPVAEALAANGVTVNGLVIKGAKPDPERYYIQNVVRGTGAFLEVADGFEDFPRAIRRKLLRELAPAIAAR